MAVGGIVYLTADDGVYGREPWKFDGAQAVRLFDINSGSLVDRGGSLVFVASDDTDDGPHVWMYAGSSDMRVGDRIGASGLTTNQD